MRSVGRVRSLLPGYGNNRNNSKCGRCVKALETCATATRQGNGESPWGNRGWEAGGLVPVMLQGVSRVALRHSA